MKHSVGPDLSPQKCITLLAISVSLSWVADMASIPLLPISSGKNANRAPEIGAANSWLREAGDDIENAQAPVACQLVGPRSRSTNARPAWSARLLEPRVATTSCIARHGPADQAVSGCDTRACGSPPPNLVLQEMMRRSGGHGGGGAGPDRAGRLSAARFWISAPGGSGNQSVNPQQATNSPLADWVGCQKQPARHRSLGDRRQCFSGAAMRSPQHPLSP